MASPSTLKVSTPNDQEIVMTREFSAPRALVYAAFITPAYVKRWLSGLPGWSMVVCDMDVRVGGTYRWVWRRDDDGTEMGMGGVYREVVEPERIVSTEKFDEAWYPGEALGTILLVEKDGRTTMTQTVRYESREARDMAMTGMEDGVEMSYDRLADLLTEMPA
jgi:uncharacterized protein YndB with AHSA1/START domain